jgi:hypothetical protein
MWLVLLAAIEVIGFSPDDRYVAWVEHGLGSGSGNAFATLHLIDVRRSAPAQPPVEIRLDSDDEAAAVAQARAAAESAREKLHLGTWKPAREVPHDKGGAMTDHEGAPIGALELKSRSAGPRERARCEEPFAPLLLKLTLFFADDDRPARLAEEKKPPVERPCASGCALDKIYAHGKAALVLVKCSVPGYEGPATKYTAYTGVLPYDLD